MENNDIGEILAKVREAFQGGHPLWALSLVRNLENASPKLALKWGIEVLEKLLPKLYPHGHPEGQSLLSDFSVESNLDVCKKRCEEIWCRPRNSITTAISNLYAALGCKLIEDDKCYFRHIAGALMNLAGDENFKQEHFEEVLSIYQDWFLKYRCQARGQE